MSWLSRLFRNRPDPRDALRPLWHRVVEIARERQWYAEHGVADTVAGRFDMITAVLCLVLIRLEREPELKEPPVLLTELFVADMDGQLRESGVGDVVVGKHIGRLMSVLGGRLGAYRDALREPGDEALAAAIVRNLSLVDGADAAQTARALRQLEQDLAAMDAATLVAGRIER
ncbi:MAG: ubiquinol-cytochrome C chaperone family protein [Novosphingobium sp.]|nr:ubiquinol-cytochrome C chaperone family protein [Novosphingobium sp.]